MSKRRMKAPAARASKRARLLPFADVLSWLNVRPGTGPSIPENMRTLYTTATNTCHERVQKRMHAYFLANDEFTPHIMSQHLPESYIIKPADASQFVIEIILLGRLCHEATSDRPLSPAWHTTVFLLVWSLMRTQWPALSPTTVVEETDIHVRMTCIIREAMNTGDVRIMERANVLNKVYDAVNNNLELLRDFASTATLVAGGPLAVTSIFHSLGSWRNITVTPTKKGPEMCAVTQLPIPVGKVSVLTAETYNGNTTTTFVHSDVVPLVRVAHGRLNMGLILARTPRHFHGNFSAWMKRIADVYSGMVANFATELERTTSRLKREYDARLLLQ